MLFWGRSKFIDFGLEKAAVLRPIWAQMSFLSSAFLLLLKTALMFSTAVTRLVHRCPTNLHLCCTTVLIADSIAPLPIQNPLSWLFSTNIRIFAMRQFGLRPIFAL
jgi:hypothetical protein